MLVWGGNSYQVRTSTPLDNYNQLCQKNKLVCFTKSINTNPSMEAILSGIQELKESAKSDVSSP
jgi:hypothetical protein